MRVVKMKMRIKVFIWKEDILHNQMSMTMIRTRILKQSKMTIPLITIF